MWVDTRMTHGLDKAHAEVCAASASFAVADVDTTAFRNKERVRDTLIDRFSVPAIAASLLLAACGSSTSSSGTARGAGPTGIVVEPGEHVAGLVKTASNTKLGATVLVDAQGMTLYALSAERNGKFVCTTSACVGVWRPLTVSSSTKPTGCGRVPRDDQAPPTARRRSPTRACLCTRSRRTPRPARPTGRASRTSEPGTRSRPARARRPPLRLPRPRPRPPHRAGATRTDRGTVAIAGAILALSGCGSSQRPTAAAPAIRPALERYLSQIEPLRLAVNRLLEGADPTLAAFRDHRITRKQAAQRIGALELRFATFTVEVNSIEPSVPAVRSLQASTRTRTYLEDAYLSALVSGLANDELGDLPNTQACNEPRSSRGAPG